ncbi:MAG: ErfK/YbiS/YcfS/YnhG family protein [Flaviaesturariibacter sp.]|nr:ErfK/YbiS/YcfS/YnhG family protein [Flaviaesturariibacter sp.]
MKTALLLSCLLAGTAFLPDHSFVSSPSANTKALVKTAKPTRASGVMPVGTVRIVIDKSNYELQVFDDKGWYATYPVVFGNNTLADKCVEGDRCTPEGTFRIVNKRPHEKWCRYMGLDYPTQESLARFNELKRRGAIPKNASPGGGVGIHGTWPHDDYMIDRYSNWTNGCISMKNNDMIELYTYVQPGTTVTIKK